MTLGEAIFKIAKMFLELFRESVVIQATLTLLLATVMCVLILRGDPVPEVLLLSLGTVMGFWFKTKNSKQQAANIQAIAEGIKQAKIHD